MAVQSCNQKGQTWKFPRPWGGPYRICEKLSDVTYCVQHTGNNKCQVVHFDRLKKCPENIRLLPRKPTTGARDPQPQPVSPPPVGSSLELLEDDDVDQGVVNPVPNGHPPAAQQLEHGDLLIDFKVEYVDVFSVEGDICNATNGQHLKC